MGKRKLLDKVPEKLVESSGAVLTGEIVETAEGGRVVPLDKISSLAESVLGVPAAEYRGEIVSRSGDVYVIDGESFQLYSNGAIRDIKRGKVCALAEWAYTFGDNVGIARLSTRARLQEARAAALEGLSWAQVGVGSESALFSWSNIVFEQARLASDISKGRDSTRAAVFVGQAAGLLGDKGRDSEADKGESAPALAVSEAGLSVLRDILRDVALSRGESL